MFEGIDDLVEEGYLTRRKHPDLDLYILNYTARTQYEGLWNDITTQCRGLVVNREGLVKSRCFRKFFNLEQVAEDVDSRIRDNLPFRVYDKVDGSLGITYWTPDGPRIATRGSFTSEQAVRATNILHEAYRGVHLDPDLTYLFEIVYPENRVCVDYGETEDIFLLGAIHTESGVEIEPEGLPFPCVESFDFGSELGFSDIKKMNLRNREGFVVRFDDGFRFKIKFEDYVKMHREIFSLSTKSIWEALSSGRRTSMERIPDGTRAWVEVVEHDLMCDYASVECKAAEIFESLKHLPRREFAAAAEEYRFSSVLFRMLDGKPYSEVIWKMIQPEFRRPKHEEV
jgi:hypothetical protein